MRLRTSTRTRLLRTGITGVAALRVAAGTAALVMGRMMMRCPGVRG